MTELLPEVIAADDGITMPQGLDYVEIDPFANDTANLGIDPLSLVVTGVSDNSAPAPRWNEVTGKLRIYRPTVGTPAILTVTYYFKDFLGNASNEASIVVTLTIIATGWRAYAPSLICLTNAFSQNTGYRQPTTLEKYYPSTSAAFIPQALKPNVSTDPDYIAPAYNTTACPLPSMVPFSIYNNTSGGNTVTLTLLTLNLSGNPPQTFPISIGPGTNAIVYIPVAFYDSADVSFTHTGAYSGTPWEFNYGPGGIGSIAGTVGAGPSFSIASPPVSAPAVALTIN